jgi:hypothetical protein
MSVNKNFVVKNGLEVNQRLILANATTGKVGIGTSQPGYLLDVAGGIGVTDAYIRNNLYTVGVGTFVTKLSVGTNGTTLTGVGGSVGVGTSVPEYLLDVRSPVSTGATALYVKGDVRVTGDLVVEDDITLDEVTVRNITANSQATILNLNATGITTTQNLNVTGVSTLGTLQVSSGIVTSSIVGSSVTYYGDGSNLTGIVASSGGSIGIQSGGVTIGTAITTVNFVGSGLTASQSGNTSNVYLPPAGVSLGLAIALGG